MVVEKEGDFVFRVVVSALSVSLSFDGGDDRLTGDDAITIIIFTVLGRCCDS